MIEERKAELLNRLREINEVTQIKKNEPRPGVGEIIMLLHEFGEILKSEYTEFHIDEYVKECRYYNLIKGELDKMINMNQDFQEYISSNKVVTRNFQLLYKNCITGSLSMPSDAMAINTQRVIIGRLFDTDYKIRVTKQIEPSEHFEEYEFLSEEVQKINRYYGHKILEKNEVIFVNNSILSTVIIVENMYRLIEKSYTKGDIATLMKYKQRVFAQKK